MLRFGASVLALTLALGGPVASAFAQETEPTTPTPTSSVEPTPTTTPAPTETTAPSEPSTPSETPTPTETSTPPSENPVPSESSAPPEPPQQAPQTEAEQQLKPQVEEKGPKADLKVTVAFDQAEYQPEKNFGLTVTVRNAGDAPAKDIRFATESYSVWLRSGLDELSSRPSLAPGEQKVIKLGATARDARSQTAELSVRAYLDGIADPTPRDNESTGKARVVQKRGTASGVLYTDGNGNGRADEGEGVANYYIHGDGGSPHTRLFAKTDAGGRFQFHDLAPGAYRVNLQELNQYPRPGGFVVEDGKNTVVDLAVTAPISDSLKADVELDRDRYGKADPVSVKVTLRNTGQAPLASVVAICTSDYYPDWYLDGTGAGWAALSPDGPGVSLAAGETKVVVVTDVVPDAAYLAGDLGVACNFGNNGHHLNGAVGDSDFALVDGAFGTVKGKVVHGETGAALEGVRIVGLNPATGRPITGVITGPGGAWQATHVPKGGVVFRAVGPWKHADGSNGLLVDVIGSQEVTADFAVVPGPEVADPARWAPDVKVTATFDQPSYDVYDRVQIKLTVTNVGTGLSPAWGRLDVSYLQNDVEYDRALLDDLTFRQVQLWPGESREVTLVGGVRAYSTADSVAFKARFVALDDVNQNNNTADISAPVTYGTGDAAVTVYGDQNENGQLDAGEELAGKRMHINGGRPVKERDGTTDASGKVAFPGLSAGKYRFYLDYENGDWVSESPESTEFIVEAGGEAAVLHRMVRPLSDKVTASMKFIQPTYAPGDTVHLSVTLTNNLPDAVTLFTHCGGYGDPYELGNHTPGWGLLHYDSPGVPLVPGETKTLEVSAPLPEAAYNHGLVEANCGFGPKGLPQGSPFASAKAKVPGAVWTTVGSVVKANTYPTEKIGNVKVVLLDPDTEKPVARTVTNADGDFTFPDLPTGHYTPVVVGPWKVVFRKSGPLFEAVKGQEWPQAIFVEPGPQVADPDTGKVAPPVVPGGLLPVTGGGGGLATTGVSVLGISMFGLLLLLAGTALRGTGRRKTTA